MNLFPAYAGVILLLSEALGEDWAFPRVCGGDPKNAEVADIIEGFSPRMRG